MIYRITWTIKHTTKLFSNKPWDSCLCWSQVTDRYCIATGVDGGLVEHWSIYTYSPTCGVGSNLQSFAMGRGNRLYLFVMRTTLPSNEFSLSLSVEGKIGIAPLNRGREQKPKIKNKYNMNITS